jgi:hypothetical protein
MGKAGIRTQKAVNLRGAERALKIASKKEMQMNTVV